MTSQTPLAPTVSLLARMIEDMTLRGFGASPQRDYVRFVSVFADFLGRSPDCVTVDDLRAHQLHQAKSGVQPPTINGSVSALRFFFSYTINRHDLSRHLIVVHQPRKLPSVLSIEEVTRLLVAAPGPKYKAALDVAYGARLRVSEVAMLKVSDIDSTRMILRVERGKGAKDRNAMLSPQLLELLRAWWRVGKQRGVMFPHGWMFPDMNPLNPVSPRHINRIVHDTAEAANIKKRVTPHTFRHSFATPFARGECRHPCDPGAVRPCQARDHGALYAGFHQDDPASSQPARTDQPTHRQRGVA